MKTFFGVLFLMSFSSSSAFAKFDQPKSFASTLNCQTGGIHLIVYEEVNEPSDGGECIILTENRDRSENKKTPYLPETCSYTVDATGTFTMKAATFQLVVPTRGASTYITSKSMNIDCQPIHKGP